MNLLFEIEPGNESWTVFTHSLACGAHVIVNPLQDERFVGEVREFREWAGRPILRRDPLASGNRDYLQRLSRKVGERITSILLAESAREALAGELVRAKGQKVRLTIRVRDLGALGDAALALPWELLSPEPGTFAVRSRSLQIVREVMAEGAPDLPAPDGSLAVAVMIAAPEDRTAVLYEEESFRLQLALSSLGHQVAFSDLGGVRDLVQLVDERSATVVHFSGHGLPGRLLFEDELGFAEEVAVEELQRRLNQVLLNPLRGGFPRLFFLSSCYGATRSGDLDASPSTAAALHRRGFAQVMGYFGPVDAELSSRAEEAFYRVLARGETALAAAEALRATLDLPLGKEAERDYPLGWSQLAVYHRGPDLPLAIIGKPVAVEAADHSRRKMVQVSGLPVLERGFIGRRGLQHEVLRRVRSGQRLIVLQGLGGLGKTALASQLVSRVFTSQGRADQLILRCRDLEERADPIADLRAQVEEHGRVQGFRGWDERMLELRKRISESVEGFAAVIREVRKERPNLVIYVDNAESLQVGPKATESQILGSWIPGIEAWWRQMEELAEEGTLVLVSTRYGWKDLDSRTYVGITPMSPADSLRLITSLDRLGEMPLDTRRMLAKQVDGHPRTVTLLEGLVSAQCRLLGEEYESVDVWAELIEPLLSQRDRLISLDLLLAELWRRISENAREHAKRLTILRDPAPLAVIDRLGTAREALIHSSLLTRYRQQVRSKSGMFWVERWGMQELIRDFSLDHEAGEHESLHRLAGEAYKEVLGTRQTTWGDQQEAIYHLHSAKEGDQAWPLVEDFVTWLRERARYSEAFKVLEQSMNSGISGERASLAAAFAIQIQILGGKTDDALMRELEDALASSSDEMSHILLLHEKGRLLLSQGKPLEAERILEEALGALRSTLGAEHPEYGAAIHSMAVSLRQRGKLEQAENILVHLLEMAETVLGAESELFITGLHTLGGVLEAQGKYGRAEDLLRKAASLRERIAGVTHPEYAASFRALALALAGQGRYEEAEGLLRHSLSIYQRTLEAEHPAYATTLHALAWILGRQGRYQEATTFLLQALAVLEHVLGIGHPEYGRSLHLLAWMLEQQGRHQEAEELLRAALSSIGERLGRDHSSYAAALKTLGWVLERRGKYDEAEGCLRKSLKLYEYSLGAEHPAYGTTLQTLAVVLERQRCYEEGERVAKQALAILERTLGPSHPDYGGAQFTLAGILESQGKYGAAEEALLRSLSILEEAFGYEHPSLSPILTDLAIVWTEQGRAEEGEKAIKRALAIDLTVHEAHSSEVARILNILAQVQFALRRPEAADTARQALSVLLETLGRDHPVIQEAAPILLGIIRRYHSQE